MSQAFILCILLIYFSNDYRRSGKLIRQKCGSPIKRGKLNMDAWIVNVKCGGDCSKTDITLSAQYGQVVPMFLCTAQIFEYILHF